jgi:hypothetical protein
MDLDVELREAVVRPNSWGSDGFRLSCRAMNLSLFLHLSAEPLRTVARWVSGYV